MTPELQDRVINRLVDTGAADKPWAFAVLAALEGAAELDAYLDNTLKLTMPQLSDRATSGSMRPEPPGVYVSSITVEGFRGVGKAVTLSIPPGPGLVLIVGRNGSGKSSFAEGLELLLTGRNFRWEKPRAKVWQEGWRNLHHHDRVSLKADLLVEGEGPLMAARVWKSDDIAKSDASVVHKGQPARALDLIGWSEALVTFRPFLSYNELGSLLEEGPSKLYDALSGVLGLEELVDVLSLLANARKTRQQLIDDAKGDAVTINASIQDLAAVSSDDRLTTAARALKWPSWDTTALEALVTGESKDQNSALALLIQIQNLHRPDVNAISDAVSGLRSAERACAAFAGTNAERSREQAQLLQDALRFHDKHKNTDCPVCGTADTLSPSWRSKTEVEISKLRAEAAAYDAADSARKARIREAQRFVSAPPACLAQAVMLGLPSLDKARRQCATWAEARDIDSASALADHLEKHVLEFAEAIGSLIDDAAAEATRREDAWRPVALKIAEWLPKARAALRANERIVELKAAETWWKEASGAIRDERFSPVAERAIAIWKQLRLQSNVDLGAIELEGTAQRRRVTLRVTVDGTPAEALGVMSQGELHALALSLFLPRATLPESPFRFLWIDDPVQSMDPARVEGLARALAETAKTRQVVVFTHDDRLPEAVRRLGIPATGFAVTRRAHSIVEVRPMTDPVTGHLDDARALAVTSELPPDVTSRVIPGFCRAAVEAACMEAIRRRRLTRGELHDDVESLLATNARPHPLMALALFDDEQRTADVLPRLKKIGKWSADVFQALKAGAHVRHEGDLTELIGNSERLARYVLAGSQ
jgi:ABC-type lipoprotein export system ATPase subunit